MILKVQLSRLNNDPNEHLQAHVTQEALKGLDVLKGRRYQKVTDAKMEVVRRLYKHTVEFLPFDDPKKPPTIEDKAPQTKKERNGVDVSRKKVRVVELGPQNLLPPMKRNASGAMVPDSEVCQACAVHHAPEEPHNQQSLHWQYWFYFRHKRWPTWSDAMAHCSQEMKVFWVQALRDYGIVIEPDPLEARAQQAEPSQTAEGSAKTK